MKSAVSLFGCVVRLIGGRAMLGAIITHTGDAIHLDDRGLGSIEI